MVGVAPLLNRRALQTRLPVHRQSRRPAGAQVRLPPLWYRQSPCSGCAAASGSDRTHRCRYKSREALHGASVEAMVGAMATGTSIKWASALAVSSVFPPPIPSTAGSRRCRPAFSGDRFHFANTFATKRCDFGMESGFLNSDAGFLQQNQHKFIAHHQPAIRQRLSGSRRGE